MLRVPEGVETNGSAVGKPKVSLAREVLKNRFLLGVLGAMVVAAGFLVPELMTRKSHFPESSVTQAAPGITQAGDKQAGLAYEAPSPPEAFDAQSLLARLASGTVLVLVLCAATLWIAKRWFRGALPGAERNGQLRLIETLPLSYCCTLHLVQVGKQQILAGTDRAGFKTLLALPETFEVTLATAQSTVEAAADVEIPRIVPIGNHLH